MRDFASIAGLRVGYLPSVNTNNVSEVQTLEQYLEDIRSGRYAEQVQHYRDAIEALSPAETKAGDIKAIKSSIPCCIPHSSDTGRVCNALPQNGLMQVDIDRPSLGNLYVTDQQIVEAMEACPHIFAYHRSVGGTGYVGYAYTDDPIDKAFWMVAKNIQERGLCVDLSKGYGTGDKRFMSYDPDLVIKEQFKPVEAISGVDKASIVKAYVWHRHKTLINDTEKAFEGWMSKHGGFDWQSFGPASPAGLFAGVVSKHRHGLSQDELMQMADWLVFKYTNENIVQKDRKCWLDHLDRFGSFVPVQVSKVDKPEGGDDWELVLPGLAVHYSKDPGNGKFDECDAFIDELVADCGGAGRSREGMKRTAVSVNVLGEQTGLLHYDYKNGGAPTLLDNGTVAMLFGCSTTKARSVLGVGMTSVWRFVSRPRIADRQLLSLNVAEKVITHNFFSHLPPVLNIVDNVSDEDCEWACGTLLEPLVGSRDEGEVILDYLAGHWQGVADGAHPRGRVNDIVIKGHPATGKDLFCGVLTRTFPAVYGGMTYADLDEDCKGNDRLFDSSLLINNEGEGRKGKLANAVFKKFSDSPTWRQRAMRQGAADRVRPGLCITLCNSLGLTVDASTARKIAFFQSGESTYDLKTQKPLDPAKSERLVRILQTGNFILWFRNLLATRPVDVQSVVNGHGCDKFRAADASMLFELLMAIEAGETSLEFSGEYSNFVKLEDLTNYISSSGAARDAGVRPSVKINTMIAADQLRWKERRNPSNRLTGYELPTPLNPTISGSREVRKPAACSLQPSAN